MKKQMLTAAKAGRQGCHVHGAVHSTLSRLETSHIEVIFKSQRRWMWEVGFAGLGSCTQGPPSELLAHQDLRQ